MAAFICPSCGQRIQVESCTNIVTGILQRPDNDLERWVTQGARLIHRCRPQRYANSHRSA